jgi:hypothetical protein
MKEKIGAILPKSTEFLNVCSYEFDNYISIYILLTLTLKYLMSLTASLVRAKLAEQVYEHQKCCNQIHFFFETHDLF